MSQLRYAIVTPAHNEADYIEKTIRSVVAQTVLPVRWVIVDDASTDGTGDLVAAYAAQHRWIELVRLETHTGRHFGAKVRAFDAGYARLFSLDYDVLANLDADISFEPEFIAFLLAKFAEHPGHGLIGTVYEDQFGAAQGSVTNTDWNHVPGACQFFRRPCFEEIGGYRPIPGGGIDLLAELQCRMHGWQTEAFREQHFLHWRPSGSATRSIWASRFNYGHRDYYFGSDPLFQLGRIVKQSARKPYLLGGLSMAGGYLWGLVRRTPSPVPAEVRAFRRGEQRARLMRLLPWRAQKHVS